MTNEEVLRVLAHLIGTVYTPTVKNQITEITGRGRVLGPGDMSTYEYDPQRIHVRVDNAGAIIGFVFG